MGAVSSMLLHVALLSIAAESHQATGVKVGEVTPDSALIWVRLTARPSRNAEGVVHRGVAKKQAAPGKDVENFRDACPGAIGRVRVRYATTEDLRDARDTGWA